MADNLPINKKKNKKIKNNILNFKTINKTVKKAFKNIYIIIKALSVLCVRGIKKFKCWTVIVLDKIKRARLDVRAKKALMFLIKAFILIYCICVEGALWISRVLGPKIQKNKTLNNMFIKVKSLIPKSNTVALKQPKQPQAEIDKSKESIVGLKAFKPLINKVYTFSGRNFVVFRQKTKAFFKNPKHNLSSCYKIKTFNKQHNIFWCPFRLCH